MADTPNDNMNDKNRQPPQQGGQHDPNAQRGQQQADQQRTGQQGGPRDQQTSDPAQKRQDQNR